MISELGVRDVESRDGGFVIREEVIVAWLPEVEVLIPMIFRGRLMPSPPDRPSMILYTPLILPKS